jgi:F0F1-type ATP synthase assembly protein I
MDARGHEMGKKLFHYKDNRPWMENMQVVMQLGLTMVGCIGFCLLVGYQIDKWIGIKGIFTSIFTILGVIGGGVVVYRQIMEIFEDKDP